MPDPFERVEPFLLPPIRSWARGPSGVLGRKPQSFRMPGVKIRSRISSRARRDGRIRSRWAPAVPCSRPADQRCPRGAMVRPRARPDARSDSGSRDAHEGAGPVGDAAEDNGVVENDGLGDDLDAAGDGQGGVADLESLLDLDRPDADFCPADLDGKVSSTVGQDRMVVRPGNGVALPVRRIRPAGTVAKPGEAARGRIQRSGGQQGQQEQAAQAATQ